MTDPLLKKVGDVSVYDMRCATCGLTDFGPTCDPTCRLREYDALRVEHPMLPPEVHTVLRENLASGKVAYLEWVDRLIATTQQKADRLAASIAQKQSMKAEQP